MLGKGLESLIPQKGNQGAPSDNNNSTPMPSNPTPVYVPQSQPAQPAEQPQPQPTGPLYQPPVQRTPIQQPVQRPQFQPQPQSIQSVKKDELAQESIFHIEVDKITGNPDQPRRHFDQAALHELANSIREFGFLQPIVVSKVETETPTGVGVQYQIIAGERRYMAAKLLGLPRVPAIVRNINLEREKLELGVIENIQREQLNPIETARAFQRLQEEFRMTQREIAAKLGKSREVVANAVRLLDLPEYVQVALQDGQLSESSARLLLGVEDPSAQKLLLQDILQNKLTTRDVRDRVQEINIASRNFSSGVSPGIALNTGIRRGRPPLEEVHLTPEVKTMSEELSQALGAPVEISKNANNGKISITFFSEEELESILRRLAGE
jgi:ParB family chromosome partitioning protein